MEDLAAIELADTNAEKEGKNGQRQEQITPDQQSLLDAIAGRFQQKRRIYCKIGFRDMLALNPAEQLPIYDRSVMEQFATKQENEQAHIFGIAAQAFKGVARVEGGGGGNGADEAIVFCGEAGSGKTANLFHALRYFAFIEEQRSETEKVEAKMNMQLVVALEHVLSAFGGAKTLKNDNSTRHGYALGLHYSATSLVGITVDPIIPLELFRLVQQKKGERNFACFYQFCSGLGPEKREKFGLKAANNYFYLNQGKCPGLDVNKEAHCFTKLCQSLSRIGFSEHQQELIFRLLAAILHTGNLFFRPNKPVESEEDGEEEEYAGLANEAEVRWVAHLLGADFEQLKRILTHSTQGAPLSVDGALDRRDWFAKCIYAELFHWLLSRISMFLRPPNDEGDGPRVKITLIDMPGYERYNNNGYEEFCVNLVSEKLERFFQQQRFGQFVDEELQNDRPELANFRWPNNERTLEMITKRPVGILPLLDDECKFPKGSDETFLQHSNINHLDKSIYAKARMKGRLEMGIRQHFGMAFYGIEGFLQRNRYMQVADFFLLLARSKDAGLAALFSRAVEYQNKDKWIYVADEWLKGIDKLSGQLASSNVHFVRCVRTNQERMPGKWDLNGVAKQFKALDLLEHCRAVRLAFPHKLPLSLFVKQFKQLLPDDVVRGQSIHQIAKDILAAQGVRFECDFVLGPSHVFLRDGLFGQLGEMLAFTKNFAAIIIQRNLRKFLARRAYLFKRAAITQLQAGYRGWKCRKQVAEIRERINWINKFEKKESSNKGNSSVNGERQNGTKMSNKMSQESLYDFPTELREVIEKIGNESGQNNKHEFKQCAKYIQSAKANGAAPPLMVPPITLAQFAADHFKTIILGCRREPIQTPFLPKESEEEFNESLGLYKLILRYQFEPERTNSDQLATLAKFIVQKGIDYPSLRDELFAQLLNQTHNCQCENAVNRIWILMMAAVHAFPPSPLIFPVLYNYFQSQPPALSKLLVGGLLKVSTLPEIAPTNRTFAPTTIEQAAFECRQPLALSIQFADGDSMNVAINSWTTTDELVQTVLRQRGIGDEFGWGLYIDDGKNCTEVSASLFPLDAIAQMENGRTTSPCHQSPFTFFESSKMPQREFGNQLANCYAVNKFEKLAQSKEEADEQNGNGIERDNFGQNGTSNGESNGGLPSSSSSSEFYRPSFLAPSQMSNRNGLGRPMVGAYSTRCSSQFSPQSALPFVRQRMDAGGVQFRRNANPNCMSRITEKDETESTVSTVNRRNNGGNNTNGAQNGTLGTIGRIRNMPIPSDDQNVDMFLDNVFEQALPPTDYDHSSEANEELENKFDRAIVGHLTASIKGGDFYHPEIGIQRQPRPPIGGQRRQNPLFVPSREPQQQQQYAAYHSVEAPSQPKRFVYRPGGDILLDNGHQQQMPFNGAPPHHQQQSHQPYESIGPYKMGPLPPPPPQYQPNGEFIRQPMPSDSSFNQQFSPQQYYGNEAGIYGKNGAQNEHFQNGRPFIGGGGLRRFVVNNHQFPGNNGDKLTTKMPEEFMGGGGANKYQEISRQEGESVLEEDYDSRTLQSGYGIVQPQGGNGNGGDGHGETEMESEGNEWVPESETTLDALFNAQGNRMRQIDMAIPNNNVYSARPKSNCSEIVGMDSGEKNKEKRRRKPALAYADQPFELIVRKQIFLPDEVLDDSLEIDLIFAQIIRDCRQRHQMRIRKYEKESVNQLLRSYNVSPSSLNNPSQIPTNIKLELIGIVRKWPLYFCRQFRCIEERPNGDRVELLLGVGESGVRLIAITIGGSRSAATAQMEGAQQQQQMTIQDHFEFSDIADLMMERNGMALRIITRQHIGILLAGPNLAEAKNCIEQYMGMGAKRRQFVIATAEYSTNEQNVLSFEAGDYIQLLDKPDSEPPNSAGTWLYGRLDGRFGWLPSEYVLDANWQDEQLYSASCNGISMSDCGGLSFPTGANSMVTNGTTTGVIPPMLEPLFANLEPSALFMPDNMGVERFSMTEFAVRFFRRPKGGPSIGGQNKNNKHYGGYVGDWSWKEVTDRVKHADKPIGHSLLRLESHEADKVAQQTFLCIMRFMGDESLKRNQSYTDCVYELLSLCHVYELLRDEVYCQLLKQVTANRSEKCQESGLRGWRLLSILCAYFPCSETLKPYLVKYLGDVAFDHRRTFNALAKLCMFNLAQTYRYGGRRLILGAAEVEAVANGRSVRRQWYNLPGGHRRQICTRSVTVAEEIVQALCLEMNIRSQAEQQEFTLCYLIEKDNSICSLLNDEYVMDACTDLEAREEEYLLILMRSVWLHPLRRDSELYTDALFFQLMPNYLAGLHTTLRPDGSATAATLNDVATLGALLLLSDPFQHHENAENISSSNLTSFVPKTILQLAGLMADQWAQRIRGKIEELAQHGFNPLSARQHFLEIVERWPLFGAAFYFVKRVFPGKDTNGGSAAPGGEKLINQNCVLAVNKFGVRILINETHQIVGEFALNEIREMAKYSVAETNFLELRLSAGGTQKHAIDVLTVETDLGNEISRLIGHYIFLSGSAKKQ